MRNRHHTDATNTIGETTRRTLLKMAAAGIGATALPFGALAQEAGKGGVLQVAAANNPSSLDPHTGRSGYDHAMLYPIYDTLFDFDYDTLRPIPGIVREWSSPSPTQLVLELNEGVTFHDGTPCDAEAVAYNINRAKTDKRSNVASDIESIAKVEATGPLQVTITLSEPNSAIVGILSDRPGMMVSPTALEKYGVDSDRNPVGAGPWKFVSWTDNSEVIVERNENYWRSSPALEGIHFNIIPERNTGLRSVVAGENDLVYQLSRQQIPVVERAPNVEIVEGPTLFTNMLYFNLERDTISKLKVRQALNYAVNREAFNAITQDGEPAYTCLPASHWAFNPKVAELYPYDPDRARALLAEAGYPDGFDLQAGGWNDQKAIQRQEILIEQFGQVGIRTTFTTASVSDSTSQFFGEKQGDVYLGAFTGRPDPSQIFHRIFDTDSFLNPAHVDLAEGRAVLQAKSQATSDLEERKAAFYELQMVIAENALFLPLTITYDVTAFAKRVVGFRTNLTGKPKFNDVALSE